MPRHFLLRRANCSSCAKTSAGTTPWTRLSVGRGHVLLVSGRGGFEIVQKTIAAGIPLLASVSAPSSLAVQLARELGLTLIGFLRGRRFVIYAGEERIAVPVSAPAGAS
jgi:FdhD protein